jgi:arabinofuranosyltransferase
MLQIKLNNLEKYLIYSVFFYLYIVNFYICDDAFISFRSWENLLLDNNFSYNAGERVQAYTNVLWTLLTGSLKFLIYGRDTDPNNYWNIVLTLSFVFCFATIYKIYHLTSKATSNNKWAIAFYFALLFSSKVFIDFTSSGLEYPLAYFVITLFYIRYFFDKEFDRGSLFQYTLLVSLAYLSRIDSVLLIIAPYCYVCYQYYLKNNLKSALLPICIGFLPLLIWMIFQVTYYGFLFPNTAYAKLGTGTSTNLLFSGLKYTLDTTFEDPLTIATILLGIFATSRSGLKNYAVGFSLIISIFYLLKTGGDFMGGRFFALPFLVSFLVLVQCNFVRFKKTSYYIVSTLFLIVLQITLPVSALKAPWVPTKVDFQIPYRPLIFFKSDFEIWRQNGDKFYYFKGSSILSKFMKSDQYSPKLSNLSAKIKPFPFERFHAVGSKQECIDMYKKTVAIEVGGGGGLHAFCKGPNAIVIDIFGLGDPLLSHLPMKKESPFIPGHNPRKVPNGYLESKLANENLIKDKELKIFYGRINNVTSGHIFSLSRLKDIWYLNFKNPIYFSHYD